MTKQKTTKRALLLSALSLLMCVSMLIGSTFAWFTDSVTSTGNIIKSGTLDVTMEWADGTKAVPADDSSEWTDASTGPMFKEDQLWEPGYVDVKHIKIANEGTLALKYQLNIIANGEVSELADVIDVYYLDPADQIADRTALTADKKIGTLTEVLANISTTASGELKATEKHTITLALKMQESAGNKYQDLAIGSNFSIQLLATQLTAESDSFNNQYDADATLGTYIELNAGDDLMAAMASAEEGMPLTIKLNGDVEWPTTGTHGEKNITPASSIVIDGNGYALTATGSGVTPLGDDNAPMTLKNIKIVDKSASYAENSWEFSYLEMGGTVLNCVNVEFVDPIMVESDSANFTDCSFVGYEDTTNGIKMNGVWMANGDATFSNCTFTGTRGMKICDMYAPEIGTVVIDGCTFMDLTQKPGVAIDDEDTQDMKITIKNSTFINCQPGDQELYIYETDNTVPTVENNTVYKKAVTASNNEELGAAIEDGADALILGSGNYIIPDSAKGKTLTIVGNGETVVAAQDDGAAEGDGDYSFDGSNVTFENVTITTSTTYFPGYVRMNGTYNNCTINGVYTLYGDSIFNDCTFNVSGDVYNIWTWGATNATFNGCTFNSDGKALLLYGTVNTNLTVNNCVFNDNGGLTDLKAAIEIGDDYGKSYTLTVNDTVVNGYEINDKGINTGSTLWANKNSMSTDKLNVVIDGVDVY